MKQILILFLAVSLLPACNSKHEDNTVHSDSAAVTEKHDGHRKQGEGLALNNGSKWKADSTTLVNADLLQAIVSNYANENTGNYAQTAIRLEDGLNKMISECKMKGADHDALHKWLEPIVEKTKELKKTSSAENGTAILHDIEKQVNLFSQYFEK